MAGKRKGKEDERHLWPEMLRVIREVAPKYIVGENVLGLVNWDGGLVFDEVQADLEAEGYEVAAVVIPAAAVNAPHGRDRVWFVAQNAMHSRCLQREFSEEGAGVRQQRHTCTRDTERICGAEMAGLTADTDKFANNNESNSRIDSKIIEQRRQEGERLFAGKSNGRNCKNNGLTADTDNTRNTTPRCGIERNRTEESEERKYSQPEFNGHGVDGLAADTNNWREGGKEIEQRRQEYQFEGSAIWSKSFASSSPSNWNNFPTQSPICSRNDGLSTKLDGITFSKWRNESIKAYGNAIVPQVAFEIFKVIQIIANQ